MVQRLGEILFSVPLPQPAVAVAGGFVVYVVMLVGLMAVLEVPVVVARVEMHLEELETPLQQLHLKVEMVAVALLLVLVDKAVVAAHLRMVLMEHPRPVVTGAMVLDQPLRVLVLPTQVGVVVPCPIWQPARIKGLVARAVVVMGDSPPGKAPLLEGMELPTLVVARAAARRGDPADQAL